MALHHFLILFSLKDGALIELKEFGTDVGQATDAYSELERRYRVRSDHEDFEIVLVGADSLETVKQTHSRYFDSERESAPF